MLRSYFICLKGNWDDHIPLIEFSYNNNYHSSITMEPFEALYCRRCRYPVGESSLLGPEIIYESIEKVWMISDTLKTSYSWQKSYAHNRRRDLDFELSDHFYLNIYPKKEVIKFGNKGKLSPRYVCPHEVLQRIVKVAYELKLSSELALVHLCFMFLCLWNA